MTTFGRLMLVCLMAALSMVPGCGQKTTLVVLSGSENKALEPLIAAFERANDVKIEMRYAGSLDIAHALESGKAIEADAVWPANRIWIEQGDTKHVVKNEASIMRSPVVLALKRPAAEALGWRGRKDLTLRDILQAVTAGKFRYGVTSATQSNSGATFYLAALTAFGAKPGEGLRESDLDSPVMQAEVRQLLRGADRSSGSSGWLKDYYLEHDDTLDGMVNYEGLVWEANQALKAAGKPTLCPVYPTDAVGLADHPLGLVDKGDADKAKAFKAFQDYLLSPAVQKQIQALGRRTGAIGMTGDPSVLTDAECFDTTRVISPPPLPAAPVVMKALGLYQTALRKPSATAYVLDFSGSMQGPREAGMKAAMRLLLNQTEAARLLLQASPGDIHIVVPFDSRTRQIWTAKGNEPTVLNRLLGQIETAAAGGGTDIYTPVATALRRLAELPNLNDYFPAVILLTDGESNEGPGPSIVAGEQQRLKASGISIPVFALAFGEADFNQLNALTRSAGGRVFDSRKDLSQAFKDAKGYN